MKQIKPKNSADLKAKTLLNLKQVKRNEKKKLEQKLNENNKKIVQITQTSKEFSYK